MPVGTVKWFNLKKGFGFILHPETGEDVFVHYTVIEGEGYRRLWQDEKVHFELTRGPKGWLAVVVRRLPGSEDGNPFGGGGNGNGDGNGSS